MPHVFREFNQVVDGLSKEDLECSEGILEIFEFVDGSFSQASSLVSFGQS